MKAIETQSCKFKIYNAVIESCSKNNEVFTLAPGLSLKLDYFKNQISEIKKMKRDQDQVTLDIITARRRAKEKICLAGADLESLLTTKATAFIIDKRKMAIYNELVAKKDSVLLHKLQLLCDSGFRSMDELQHYGITAPLLAEFQRMITTYSEFQIDKKRDEFQKDAAQNLKKLFRSTDLMLRSIDKEIHQLRNSCPFFFISYKECRNFQY